MSKKNLKSGTTGIKPLNSLKQDDAQTYVLSKSSVKERESERALSS